jgi:hypothetical protein
MSDQNTTDMESDTHVPSRIVMEGDDARTLHRITHKTSIVGWADETVGSTHIGKRKQNTMSRKGKGKKIEESAWK